MTRTSSSPPTRARPTSPTSPTAWPRIGGFWLGDAFASGGSNGYDHKALGVTARGAWTAVDPPLRRARRRRADRPHHASSASATCPVTCSATACCAREAIALVAAFDHRDIFVDPDPDPAASFAERTRLFGTARVVVAGLRPHADQPGRWRVLPEREVDRADPPDAEVLRVSAAHAHAGRDDPGDPHGPGRPAVRGRDRDVRAGEQRGRPIGGRSSERELRIPAASLRARVVGEGANLAFTQRARIEYARRGGRINMDAIDNSAGVDTSDREVNLKVLPRLAVTRGELSREEADDAVARGALGASWTRSWRTPDGSASGSRSPRPPASSDPTGSSGCCSPSRRTVRSIPRSSPCPTPPTSRLVEPPAPASPVPSWRSSWPGLKRWLAGELLAG